MQTKTVTELLQGAVAVAWDLPVEMQDDIARLVLAYADDLPRVFRLGEDPEQGPYASTMQATRAL